ncbi:sulfite exporter TauE/SafE family protein [Alicyclobacillus sp.]|uniref:sulfite exporter TauE/SafE family protein n=1 Tax=Alicyclobacillus sp. TaxID=61169 RepID=UPI0025BE9E7C|nr:sulfite exporter TauE/SafE family protein [Alicyclobacillus sp.]MCL6517891.1 sulfite exporter TauE/SafE family protein [Alicyclobacillus sp.]
MMVMLFGIGCLSGVITGMLSLGGGIVLIALLLFVPPLFHFAPLSMQEIGGLVTVQSIFSMLSGSVVYLRQRLFDAQTVGWMGGGGLAGSIAGAYMAGSMSSKELTLLYTLMCSLAAILMFIPQRKSSALSCTADKGLIPPSHLRWRSAGQFLAGAVIAFAGAMLGVTAGFLMVPLLRYFYPFRIKTTVGTVIMVGAVVALGSLIGRAMHHTWPMLVSLALVLGAIPGGYIGGLLAKRLSNAAMHRLAAAMVLLLTVRVWWSMMVAYHVI